MVFPASGAIKLIRVMCMERETLHGHYHPQLSNFAESNQLQTLCQRTSVQSPEVSRIVILHVHKVADICILGMIVNLSLQRKVTTGP